MLADVLDPIQAALGSAIDPITHEIFGQKIAWRLGIHFTFRCPRETGASLQRYRESRTVPPDGDCARRAGGG